MAAATLCLLAANAAAQGMQRPGPGRHAQGEGLRRAMPADPDSARSARRDAEPRGDNGRLSPEERRQLRRDVHQAGRDLYPGRMSPGRGPRRP